MYLIQKFMRPHTFEEPNGNITILQSIINTKYPAARNCAVLACEFCMMERAKKRSTNTKKVKPIPEKEGDLSRDIVEVGYFVSAYQFVCKTTGNLPTGYERELKDHRFQGGTIYNDTASSLVWVENKLSIGINDNVTGKSRFDNWLRYQAAAEVYHYHGDNGIVTTKDYKHNCNKKGQTQSFSGVGAQHQNARAEYVIQTIMYIDSNFMVQSSLHWSERGSDDLYL